MYINEVVIDEDKEKLNLIAKEVGCIFNTINWVNLFEKSIKIFGIYENDGLLIGGFFLFIENRFLLKIVQNPAFTPFIGPFFKIESKNNSAILTKKKEIIKKIAEFIENFSYSILSISLNYDILDTQPFIWKKFKVTPRYSYIIYLQNDIETIYSNFSQERKNDIKKAIKDKLYSKNIEDYNIVKNLILKTFDRQKLKINEFYLNKILFEFSNSENSFAFVTFKDERPISCTFCIYDKNKAFYILGGYDNDLKHHGAGALSILESIKYSKSLGLKEFDFEGSMVPQIEKYFRGFGGNLVSYYRVNKAKLPLEILLKFIKRELF